MALPYNPKLKSYSRELRQAYNLSEVLFWNKVKGGRFKGFKFRRQKVIGNYIADFYCRERGVVIEIDGFSHKLKGEIDSTRDKYLESLGLIVIHIQVKDIMADVDKVMQSLYYHSAFALAVDNINL